MLFCSLVWLGGGAPALAAARVDTPLDVDSDGIRDGAEALGGAEPRAAPDAAAAAGSILGVGFGFSNSPVYRIDEQTGTGAFLGCSGCPALNALARDSAGRFFSISSGFLVTIDPFTARCEPVTPLSIGSGSGGVLALAFAPDDRLYALKRRIANEISPVDLYTVDVDSGLGTLVGPTDRQRVTSLEFSSGGVLYAWDLDLGLVLIDPATGALSDLNPAVTGEPVQSLAFGPDGRLFAAWEELWEIDPAEGTQSLVGSGSYGNIRGIAFELPALATRIDIRPGHPRNPVQPRSRGVLPVALLGSAALDVSNVNPATLRLGPNGAAPVHDLTDRWTGRWHFRDVNFDGFTDLVLHFRVRETGVGCGDESMTLRGRRLDNRRFEGTDSIRTVGCRDR